MSRFHRAGSHCQWLAAGLLAALPIIVALDYGGVLRWTHYMASQAVVWILVIALLGCSLSGNWGTVRQHQLLLPLLLWLGFALFQTVPLPPAAVRLLSPASANAYTDWLNPFLVSNERPSSFPISIANQESMHGCAILAIIISVAWASSVMFTDRNKLKWLMMLFSLGASLHAIIGAWRLAFPESDALSRQFGTFVNRNNAALLLNVGLGFSLGLVAWRLTALVGRNGQNSSPAQNAVLGLFRERESVVGIVGLVCCTIGILICGSRGGLFSASVAMLLTLLFVNKERSNKGTPVIIVVVIATAVLLLASLNLKLESFTRIESLTRSDAAISDEGRLMHWQDGWTTTKAHFPAGSGLGTYAYAYLPFQEYSSETWHHHADNLWLELAAEQGIFGTLLALSILVISVNAIRRLADSPDPIDHGLRITGSFCLISIVVSQLFDFGLIMFGNLLAVTLLLPTLVARATNLGSKHRPANSTRERIRSRREYATAIASPRHRIPAVVVALMTFAIATAALPTLGRSARAESIVRGIELELNSPRFNPARLAIMLTQLESFVGKDDLPSVLLAQADGEYRLARMEEALAANPLTVESFEQQYRDTGPTEKRRAWLGQRDRGDLEPFSLAGAGSRYEKSFLISKHALTALPLSRRARSTILSLDFVPQDVGLTRAALQHLERLFRNQSTALIKIGQYAADSGERELATRAWRRALIRGPQHAGLVLDLMTQYEQYSPLDVLPSTPEAYRLAVPFLLSHAEEYRPVLRRAKEQLQCETCQSKATRSDCEELFGDVEYSLGDHSAGFERYREAIRLAPARASVRLKLIERLEKHGHYELALKAAREATDTLPNDPRFANLVESIQRAAARGAPSN